MTHDMEAPPVGPGGGSTAPRPRHSFAEACAEITSFLERLAPDPSEPALRAAVASNPAVVDVALDLLHHAFTAAGPPPACDDMEALLSIAAVLIQKSGSGRIRFLDEVTFNLRHPELY